MTYKKQNLFQDLNAEKIVLFVILTQYVFLQYLIRFLVALNEWVKTPARQPDKPHFNYKYRGHCLNSGPIQKYASKLNFGRCRISEDSQPFPLRFVNKRTVKLFITFNFKYIYLLTQNCEKKDIMYFSDRPSKYKKLIKQHPFIFLIHLSSNTRIITVL